ncbi:hypothetical protein DBT53_002595, partial [Aerococcus mictus]|uniref:hypothetical protein n=1 Tax=Aerococcus mictus TaxID=2976810 RepID=UPI002FD49815
VLKKSKLFYWIIGIYIILDGFILYGYPQRFFEYTFFTITFVVFFLDSYFRKNITKDKKVMMTSAVLIFLSFFQILVNRYGFSYSFLTTFVIVVSIGTYYYADIKKVINSNKGKIFDTVIFLTMLGSLLIQFYNRVTEDPWVVNNIYEIYYSLGRDKNVLGIIVFSFFSISFKRNSKLGIVLSIAFAIILNSRLLQVSILLFCITYIFRSKIFVLWNTLFKKRYWLAFLISLIFIILFSNVFVTYCINNGLGQYQETWTDPSNYMRMTSNIFSLNKTLGKPYFLFSGTDNYIFEFLGITENVRYLGERVVQPHNDIINLYVRCGLIYSLFYWWLLGKLLQNLVSENNIYIFLPYFFMSMFIRPIFVGPQLFIVLYTLNLESHKKSRILKNLSH